MKSMLSEKILQKISELFVKILKSSIDKMPLEELEAFWSAMKIT